MIRFNHKPLIAAVGAAALTLSVAALARPPLHPGGMHGGDITITDIEAKHAERIARIDTDGNGVISEAEFLAAEGGPHGGPGLHDADAGRHHRGPGMGGRGMGGHGMPGPMGNASAIDFEAIEDSVFTELDADHNGSLSRAEFTHDRMQAAHRKALRKAMFAQLDANDDGSLSADEMPNPVARLKALDTDGDGKVTREERKAHWRNRGGDKPASPTGTGA